MYDKCEMNDRTVSTDETGVTMLEVDNVGYTKTGVFFCTEEDPTIFLPMGR